MQPNFTLNNFRAYCFRIMVATMVFMAISFQSRSQVLYSEDFATVVPLPAGWAQQNLSLPVGTSNWFQGNTAVFTAQNGATNSYIGANFNNISGAGTISNWLFMPNVTMRNGDIFTFWTRIATGGGAFPDRLQVRMSTNGASVNAGANNTSVGDFTTLLLDINPTYTSTGYPQVWTQYTITISGLAGPTSGRLAFRYFVENGGTGANSNYIGIDNVAYNTVPPPCSGIPAPGNTLSSANPVCPGVNFTLSTAPLNFSGLTFQWQSSPDNSTWTDIAGATAATLVRNQTAATWYRLRVTCGANNGFSTPLQVLMNSPANCYCAPTYTNGCAGFGDYIARVRLGTLDNSSTCSPGPAFFTYYSSVAAPTLIKGAVYPLQVSFGPDAFQFCGVWMDINQDGDYADAGEFLGNSTTSAGANGTTTLNITIPAGANTGTTRMRIRGGDDSAPSAGQSCGASNSSFGEAEDYNVDLQPCVQGVFTTQPSNASVTCSGNTTISAAVTGSQLSLQWQEKAGASAAWTNISNGGVYSGATTASLTLTNVPGSMNGYQYRLVMVGPCTATDVSLISTLTVNPIVATVNPTSATICNGTIQQLTLTNATAPTTVVFPSGTVNIPIPDGNVTGINNSITVSGIPAGAVVTNIGVRLNITHTYVSDLEIVLRAPNNARLNLCDLLGGTNRPGANFTNTFINSTSTTPLTAGTSPHTGSFRPDAIPGPTGAFGVPAGPTGFLPTVTSFAGLTSVLNGTWTIAMYDAGPPDVGVLNSWSLEITYGAPATGVWTASPAAPNTMFTDAAATVPYVAGSQATSIFVRPAANTSYSVVYSTPTPCTSAPTTIPVNVVQDVTAATVTPASTAVCVGGGATFTVGGVVGGPVSAIQWQQSTDGGTTWTNIGGATSSTYTVSNATTAMSNTRYRAVLSDAPCNTPFNSSAGTLVVNPLPVVTLSASDLSLAPGQSSVLTASSNPAASTYAWTWNGGTLAGVTGTNYTANIDGIGTYTVSATTSAGCVSASTASVTIGTEASDKLWIYPNPTKADGVFQVRLYYAPGQAAEKRVISIFNSSGQKVMEREFFLDNMTNPYVKMEINTRDLKNGTTHTASGIYVVRVHNVYGDKTVSGQVLVQ